MLGLSRRIMDRACLVGYLRCTAPVGKVRHDLSMTVAVVPAVSPPGLGGRKRVVAYIDGMNLYYGLKESRGRRGLWLDLEKLVKSIAGDPAQYKVTQINYFTAMVKGADSAQRQQIYLDAIRASQPLVNISLGQYQNKKIECRNCGRIIHTYEEKESDVAFATALVRDAALKQFDRALIISGDADMAPAVRTARELNAQASFQAVQPPKRSSHVLNAACGGTPYAIGDRVPERNQMTTSVTLPGSNVVYGRPTHWQIGSVGWPGVTPRR